MGRFFQLIISFIFVFLSLFISGQNALFCDNSVNKIQTENLIFESSADLSLLNEIQEVYILSSQNNKTEINNLNNKIKYFGFNISPNSLFKTTFLIDLPIKKDIAVFDYIIYNALAILKHIINTRAP